jgi:hypothetical protein
MSCCVAAHDNAIADDYASLLPPNCQREFNELEDYFCYGCNPEQGEYIDEINKKLYLCKDYAERVWGDDLEDNSNAYDNCGLTTYWRGDNSTTVLPSDEWANGYDFFKECKPPFFGDYELIIVEDNKDCFNAGLLLAVFTALCLLT